MSLIMTASTRSSVVFADLAAPARREMGSNPSAPISLIRMGLVTLGILGFCVLAYLIPKKLVPWYHNRRARAMEQRLRCQKHNTWVKWVCGSRVEPQAPQIPDIEDLHIEDIELGLRRVGRTDSVQSHRNDCLLRNLPHPPEDARVKTTDIYVPGDFSTPGQNSAVMISPAVPLALRFQIQDPFRGNFDHHVPLAPVDAYQKVNSVFRKGTVEPPLAPIKTTFPLRPTESVAEVFKTNITKASPISSTH